jgi:hypothetical protein
LHPKPRRVPIGIALLIGIKSALMRLRSIDYILGDVPRIR